MKRVLLTGLAIGLGWAGIATVTALVLGRVIRYGQRGPDVSTAPLPVPAPEPSPLLGVVLPRQQAR